ncbi:MAG: hypothetical protein PHW13_00960 [Methylococcales bacterium]|nr:hypothetical protein [Methylococcales bacterium]
MYLRNWLTIRIAKTDSKPTAREDFLAHVIRRLTEIDRENAGNPAVPANFDPYAYLFLNLDIFYNAIPPYQHFIDFGRHEHGRQWRWPEQ